MKTLLKRISEIYPTPDNLDEETSKIITAERRAFTRGAIEQHTKDMLKLKNVMDILMLDTKDKAEIMKAMDGRLDKLEE